MFKFLLFIIALALDFSSKLWITKHLIYENYGSNIINTKFFGLNLWLNYNSGIAFGLFNNSKNYSNIIFMIITILTVIGILYIIITSKYLNKLQNFAMLLILSGAIGNLIDRIIYGHVIDFIDFYLVFKKQTIHWYTFNVADLIICIGTGLFVYSHFKTQNQ